MHCAAVHRSPRICGTALSDSTSEGRSAVRSSPPDDQRRPLSARERLQQRQPSYRRSSSGVRLLVGCLLPLVIGLAVVWFVSRQIFTVLEDVRQDDPREAMAETPSSYVPPADLGQLRNPFTVLLLGVDRRPDDPTSVRSDTMIAVYVEPQAGWASMLSVPRDSVATIPGLGERKINAAYSYGFQNAEAIYGAGTDPAAAGGALAAETLSGFLGTPIDYVVQVDFSGFERLVDVSGGLLITIPRPLLDSSYPTPDYGYERIYIPAGLQLLDGATALKYARSRHGSNDFDRAQRQQAVLRALLERVRQRGLLDQAALLPSLTAEVTKSIQTTLPIDDLAVLRGLVELARGFDSSRIVSLTINPSDVSVVAEVGSDIYWNEAELAQLVARWQAGPAAEVAVEQAVVQVLNGAGVPGLAGRVTAALEARGYEVLPAGDAPALRENSLLIDYGEHGRTRTALAGELGLTADRVLTAPPEGAPPDGQGADLILILGNDYNPAWTEAP
jgi:polyisoprenyl-teichoic acid--peptidoglycan teichoic acid transferase